MRKSLAFKVTSFVIQYHISAIQLTFLLKTHKI